MALLRVNYVSKKLAEKSILNNISFEQAPLQKIAIVGETGSGKSTLLKIIAGWIQPDDAEIYLEAQRIKGPDEKLIPGQKEIAYLSQHFELRKAYRVEELLSYAHLLKRKTDQLSGGERQRIAIARLLISAPKLLLLDEPFSNLDLIHKNILKTVIREIGERLQITCLMVSHDPQDIFAWADQIIILKAGAIIQQGTPEEVYHHPVDDYAAGLLGIYQICTPAIEKLFELSLKNNQQFLRPEYFKIVAEGAGIKAVIDRIFFMGGWYEIQITLADTLITLKTMETSYQKGDTVFLQLVLPHISP
ncbi:MAG: ABC transporter ATP-binding protein [Bacteroidetes bacterium]|nr:ABC transporter ATP-binding protein [Bacteroidota bacterium]